MPLTRSLVKYCYTLESSSRYNRRKRFFFDLMENPRSAIRPYFDSMMIMLVLSSVFLLIYEVKTDLGIWADIFEWFAVSIFLLEYLLRLWLYNDSHKIIIAHYERSEFISSKFKISSPLKEVFAKKWDYMTSPLAIIDLLAIIPSYRPLRFLRIFLLFRLFKLFRYSRNISEFSKIISEKRFELYTLAIFITFMVFIAASAFYFFESQHEESNIHSFFDSVYWALVTLSTVGYGDITPHTSEGRAITLGLILSGIGVLAFTTSVIVSAFSEKINEMRDNRVIFELEKKKSKHTIVCGFGRVGQSVCERLKKDREHFVIIDQNPEHIIKAKRLGYLVIEGNAQENELLEQVGIRDQAERILCLTGDDVANVYITLTARYLNPGIKIISRANHEQAMRKLYQAGADHTVAPFKSVALITSEYIGQPVAFEAIYAILSVKEGIGLDTVTIHTNTSITDTSISEIDFLAHKLILFGIISPKNTSKTTKRRVYELRNSALHFNPSPEFVLSAGDTLVLIGHEYSITHFKEQLELNKSK